MGRCLASTIHTVRDWSRWTFSSFRGSTTCCKLKTLYVTINLRWCLALSEDNVPYHVKNTSWLDKLNNFIKLFGNIQISEHSVSLYEIMIMVDSVQKAVKWGIWMHELILFRQQLHISILWWNKHNGHHKDNILYIII